MIRKPWTVRDGKVVILSKVGRIANRYVIVIPKECIDKGVLNTKSIYRVTLEEAASL